MYSPVLYTGEKSCTPDEPISDLSLRSLKRLHQGWIQEMRDSPLEALVLCQKLSQRFDILITALAADMQRQNTGIAVVALGGYGREELYPYSDIDVLILSGAYQNPQLSETIQSLLYPLWDLGLKVGHSLQTVNSALKLARTDHTFATALLESRLICGDSGQYQSLEQAKRALFTPRFTARFIQAKYTEQKQRHVSAHRMLEPNLKDGAQGLRDLQTIRWCSQALCGVPDPLEAELLSPAAFQRFRRGYRVLSRIRLHVHLQPDGKDNHLWLHHQASIATAMGFRHHEAARPIERFMKWLLLIQTEISLVSEIAEKHLITRGFLAQESFASEPEEFQNPAEVLRFLCDTQLCDTQPSYCAATLEKLWGAQKLFKGRSVRTNKIRLQLRHILSSAMPPKRLDLINRLGILGAILPDFQHIRGLTQLDGYHVWSVDHHTLLVLHNLQKQSHEADADHAIFDPALFFAALLHDIAKGRGGDHAEKGAVIAEKIAPEFGFNASETARIAWLVRQHLLLSDLALHRDILDHGTLETLLEATPDAFHLQQLHALTIADIQAVSTQSWTTWKASVIARLYHHAITHFSALATPVAESLSEAIQTLRAEVAEISDADFARHRKLCTRQYFDSTTLAVQIEHARMMTRLQEPENRNAHIRLLPDSESAIVRLVLYTRDYSGLIAHTVGTLTEAGYSIVTLKTFPYGDHCILMTVWFHHQGKAFFEEARLERLKDRLSTTLSQRYIDMSNRTEHPALPRGMPTKITFDNAVSKRATVIEVRTHNRPGLLFDLATALSENKLKIHAAKVDTFGNRAMDVFYVRDSFGLKIERQERLERIYGSIMARMGNMD